MKVPTMGDSITEGTIVEWTAQVGHAVNEGDVVALVETDKVTVDIKAEVNGVLVAQFGNVDDTVEVGGDLYQIDTDAEVSSTMPETISAGTTPSTDTESTNESPATANITSDSGTDDVRNNSERVPSIQFLGKEGWKNRLERTSVEIDDVASTDTNPAIAIQNDSVVFNPMFGRPEFSENEIEALIMGGANIAPGVKSYSSGAQFRQ